MKIVLKMSEIKAIKKYLNWALNQELDFEEKMFVRNLLFGINESIRESEKDTDLMKNKIKNSKEIIR